jgi:protein TonB
VATIDPYGPERRDVTLWSVAALMVAAAHVGVIAAYMLLRPAPEGMATAPVFDVAFMPATSLPAVAEPQAPPAEQVPPAELTLPVEQSDLAPQPEPAPPPVASTTPIPIPQTTPLEEPTAALPPPAPAKPSVPVAKPVTIPELSTHKPVKDGKTDKEKEQRKTAPPRAAATLSSSPARMASAPNRSADSEGARAERSSWNSELADHIRRNATYSSGGNQESGTAQISVTVDRNGRLLSHRIAASSGSPTLDRAAMAVIERAQPFPPFPSGMTQAQVSLIIPLRPRPR